jgi:Ca2+-binding EF-hand superfamily protein
MTRRHLLITLTSAAGFAAASAVAQKAAADSQDKLATADGNVKDLLLLMDADQNGKISKREWMSFMEAEFNKLDTDGNGELDAKELAQSRLSTRHVSSDRRS